MQLAVYCLVYPILWIISKLPWRLFYLLSDITYILLYYIIGYRRKTVTQNLKLAFPEKSNTEIKKIRKASYKHTCDIFLEMIRSLSISGDEMIQRFHISNLDELKKIEAKGQNIIIVMGHYNSYEWTNTIELVSSFTCVGIYKPIKNKYLVKFYIIMAMNIWEWFSLKPDSVDAREILQLLCGWSTYDLHLASLSNCLRM